jgi:hypothetical protein
MEPVDLKTHVAHSARIYDYILGGKDNFAADRKAAEQLLGAVPNVFTAAKQNRAFLIRAGHHLAAEAGIRQFLDVGTGIPTHPNLHEVVQSVAPDSRIVYADNDPIVLAHARALLTSTPEGQTAYIDADLRNPKSILSSPELLSTLDLTKPVSLTVVAILHFVPDEHGTYGIIRELMDALPSGSYLTFTHLTADFASDQVERVCAIYRRQGIPIQPRSRDEIAQFFDGMELVEPGIQAIHRWRPDGAVPEGMTDEQVGGYAAMGRKL